MQQAQNGALYIWVFEPSVWYAKELAHRIGRDDLEITSPRVFADDGMRFRGKKYPEIIVDHACRLTERQLAVVYYLRKACVRAA